MKEIKNLPEIDPVVLPKLGNMRPGVYILAILIFVIALALFIIGFLPGILNGGRFVNFSSSIENVGVYVDGEYRSGIPTQTFIKSGEREITYKKGGIEIGKETLNIDHPVFFTWLIRRNKDVIFTPSQLSDEKTKSLRSFDLQMIIDQSSILSFTDVVNYIPYINQYAKDAVAFNFDQNTIKEDLRTISSFVTSIEMFNDLKTAYDYLGIEDADSLKVPQILFGGTQSEDLGLDSKTIEPVVKAENLSFDNALIEGIHVKGESFVMGNKSFATYPDINEAGKEVTVDSFNLSTLPVTQYLYSMFVKENSYWSKSNIDQLIKDNKVDSNYLKGIALSTTYPSMTPITNISYYAAEAFSSWLSEKTGKTCYIPNQEQWTLASYASVEFINDDYATSLTSLNDNPTTFSLMLGGVWELTSSQYIPQERLIDVTEIKKNLEDLNINTDIIVKGGSILNKNININNVGVMGKNQTFEYLGFRVAWN